MVGRATLGNPWIIERIKHFLETGNKLPEVSNLQKLEIIKEHLDLLIKDKGEAVAIKEFRKHLAAYSKGIPESSDFRSKINMIETRKELEDEIERFLGGRKNV